MDPLSPSFFLKIKFNIIVLSTPTPSKLSLSFRLAYRNPGCISVLPHTRQFPVYIILIVLIKVMKFGGSTSHEFPTAPSYFVPLKAKLLDALLAANDADRKDYVSCKCVFTGRKEDFWVFKLSSAFRFFEGSAACLFSLTIPRINS